MTHEPGDTLTPLRALGRPAVQVFTASGGASITSDSVTSRGLAGKVYGETIDATVGSFADDGVGRLVRADLSGSVFEYRYDTNPCGTATFGTFGSGMNAAGELTNGSVWAQRAGQALFEIPASGVCALIARCANS